MGLGNVPLFPPYFVSKHIKSYVNEIFQNSCELKGRGKTESCLFDILEIENSSAKDEMAPQKRGAKRKLSDEKENEKVKEESDMSDSDDTMPDYEKMRLKNIEDRRNKFEELKVSSFFLVACIDFVLLRKNH